MDLRHRVRPLEVPGLGAFPAASPAAISMLPSPPSKMTVLSSRYSEFAPLLPPLYLRIVVDAGVFMVFPPALNATSSWYRPLPVRVK